MWRQTDTGDDAVVVSILSESGAMYYITDNTKTPVSGTARYYVNHVPANGTQMDVSVEHKTDSVADARSYITAETGYEFD